jgi:hypothetical protein
MRSIKFDQLGRKAKVLVPPVPLVAGAVPVIDVKAPSAEAKGAAVAPRARATSEHDAAVGAGSKKA